MTETIKLTGAERRKLYAAREDFVVNLFYQIKSSDHSEGKPELTSRFIRQCGVWLIAVKSGDVRSSPDFFPPLFKTATELKQAIDNGEVVLVGERII